MTPTSIAQAIYKIGEASEIQGIFNLCTGKGISVREAVSSMASVKSFNLNTSQLEPGNSKSPRIVGSNSKILSYNLKLNLTWDPQNDAL
jgi:UDP-glucose 4-epimerase